jgi:SAM-dependent methyltransferase
MRQMTLLNLGAGGHAAPDDVRGDLREIQVDIAAPADVIADLRNLPFDDDYADAVYSSHVIEHFDERDLVGMVAEWRRVLKPGGTMTVSCPDAQSAARFIAQNGIDAVAYVADGGQEIRGQDLFFGYAPYFEAFGARMRHRVAFDMRKLAHVLSSAGFTEGNVFQYEDRFELVAVAVK